MAPHDLIGAGWRFPTGVDGRGGIALATQHDEIEQAIELIVTTPKGQRVMRPEFGCRVHELVFAPINVATITAARHYVAEALAMWEPRIDVVNIDVDVDQAEEGCLLITIIYQLRATHDERALVYPFYTIPEE